MTDGFVNIWVEQRGRYYHAIVETGDGRRTTSPAFRTRHAANKRAEQALDEIKRMFPHHEIVARDDGSGAKPMKSAVEWQAESDARHGAKSE